MRMGFSIEWLMNIRAKTDDPHAQGLLCVRDAAFVWIEGRLVVGEQLVENADFAFLPEDENGGELREAHSVEVSSPEVSDIENDAIPR